MKLRLGFVSNSSSSCFICSTDKTEEEVLHLLNKMIELYNEASGESYTFDDVFLQPKMGSKKLDDELEDYADEADTTGKLIIESRSDNTIPSELFDLIEMAFNATRIHLG
jgi:hypothetical protein